MDMLHDFLFCPPLLQPNFLLGDDDDDDNYYYY